MVEASRKHGPFDARWQSARKESAAAVSTAPPLRAAEAAEALDCEAFSNRYFPGRRRHDMEALTAYATYSQGREWRTTPPRLSVVPTEQAAVKLEWGAAETGRLLDAIAAYQMERRREPMARDVQRELRDIDAEIKLRPSPGLGARFRRTARRASAGR